MCGICGVAASDPRETPLDEHAVRAMTNAIRHRGPDDEGQRLEPGVALGMRRLSIIDLPGSHQPLSNEDGSVWAVFNGEIYNYRELRAGLQARGHRLATDGDTETIVHLYEEHGPRFVEHLRGMFAIALWDSSARRLVLARDRMGVKPLYLAEGPYGLAFASEVKSLVAGGIVDPRLDPVGAELFLAHGYVPGPRTLFAGVRKLMPASILVWEDGRVREESEYWNAYDAMPRDAGRDWREDQDRLLDLLGRSTRARMISDVPLGVMLSGGLDSSLITALMAEASSGPVSTFSIGFEDDPATNELADARTVAERLGTDHHEITTRALDHPQLLDEALWYLEEPIADLSCVGFLLLSELARKHVKVALSGQGADELLGGYRKHQIAALAGRVASLPGPLRAVAGKAGRRGPSSSTVARGLIAAATDDPAERLLAMSRIVQAEERAELLSPDFMLAGADSAITESVRQHVRPGPRTVLEETLHLDSRLALVDNMLLYFDKMSMAASLEVRVPFMDHDLVSFCAALPDSRRVWRNRRKEILRRASRGLVADEIIDKKKRGFFHSALETWLGAHRETLVADVLLDDRARERGMYREDGLRELIDVAGKGGKKASQRLFCLLLLEKWQRFYVDSDGEGRRLARGDASLPARGPLAEVAA